VLVGEKVRACRGPRDAEHAAFVDFYVPCGDMARQDPDGRHGVRVGDGAVEGDEHEVHAWPVVDGRGTGKPVMFPRDGLDLDGYREGTLEERSVGAWQEGLLVLFTVGMAWTLAGKFRGPRDGSRSTTGKGRAPCPCHPVLGLARATRRVCAVLG